ncbi:MAG: molybdopterin-dependent oxidoreductase [Chloroflexi bacterium]|nr:molybdopterin-dependent oxidoreductase [Chloroflexota bacterium]
MIKVNVNEKLVEVEPGATVMDAAKKAGVDIPTLCHHPKLHPYGACRLCLVEVEGARTLVPSCTAPATDNMVVHTDTPRVKKARNFVLSMLFSERNHFCMYCQATDGDCELQNAAYAEDMNSWPFTPHYLPYAVDASHPDFVLDNNRCILCRRCVRTCGELIGNYTLGFEERGSSSFLVADSGVPLGESTCISCGNCVQFCPTGAFLDRRSAYQGRLTDLTHTESVCVDCSLGCIRDVQTRDNRLVRIDGALEGEVNQGLLCERGRYKPFREDRERVNTPLIRRNGQLVPASWEEALNVVVTQLKANGSDDISALISPRQSVEAFNAFSEFFRDNFQAKQVGLLNKEQTAMVGVKLAEEFGLFESPVTALQSCDSALLLGADIEDQHQVAGFMLKRQIEGGLKLYRDDECDQPAVVDEFKANATADSAIVLGKCFVKQDNIQAVRDILAWASKTNVKVVLLKGKANAYAAALFGVAPCDREISSQFTYMALGDQHSCQNTLACLEQAAFKVVQAAYQCDLTDMADIVLPAKTCFEEEGHYLSGDGKLNLNRQALQADNQAKSTAEVIALLAGKLGLTLKSDWKAALTKRPTTLTLAL